MQSKNKKAMTKDEREWIDAVKALDCVACNEPGPSEAHEFEQGMWFACAALCPACHRGPSGWHGTRDRLKAHKANNGFLLINRTIKGVGRGH